VYKPQLKTEKEFELLFKQLNDSNKSYALGVLHSLYYAQETSQKGKGAPDDTVRVLLLICRVRAQTEARGGEGGTVASQYLLATNNSPFHFSCYIYTNPTNHQNYKRCFYEHFKN